MLKKRCPNCGFVNEKEAKFCEKCGMSLADAEKALREKQSKMKKAIIFGSISIVVLVATIVGFNYFSRPVVDLKACAEEAGSEIYHIDGYNNNGVFDWNLSIEGFTSRVDSAAEPALKKFITEDYDYEEWDLDDYSAALEADEKTYSFRKFMESVSIDADKVENLSNGDEIKVTIKADEKAEKNAEKQIGVRIEGVNEQYTIKVKGLEERADTQKMIADNVLMDALEAKAIEAMKSGGYLEDKKADIELHSISYLKRVINKESTLDEEDKEYYYHDLFLFAFKTKEKENDDSKTRKTYYRGVLVCPISNDLSKDSAEKLKYYNVYYTPYFLQDVFQFDSAEDLMDYVNSMNEEIEQEKDIKTEITKLK